MKGNLGKNRTQSSHCPLCMESRRYFCVTFQHEGVELYTQGIANRKLTWPLLSRIIIGAPSHGQCMLNSFMWLFSVSWSTPQGKWKPPLKSHSWSFWCGQHHFHIMLLDQPVWPKNLRNSSGIALHRVRAHLFKVEGKVHTPFLVRLKFFTA